MGRSINGKQSGSTGRGKGRGNERSRNRIFSDGLTKHERKMNEVKETTLKKHGFSLTGLVDRNKGKTIGNELRELKAKLISVSEMGQCDMSSNDRYASSGVIGISKISNNAENEAAIIDLLVARVKTQIEACIAVGSNLHEIFSHFDKDKSGMLNAEEFQEGLKVLGIDVNKRNAMKLMDRFGSHAGCIDYTSFVADLALEKKTRITSERGELLFSSGMIDDQEITSKTLKKDGNEESSKVKNDGVTHDVESHPMTLRFEILAARNLIPVDEDKQSEPYAMATLVHAETHTPLGGRWAREYKTKYKKTKKKTLNADWEASEQIWEGLPNVDTGHVALRIFVYGHEIDSAADGAAIGAVIIPLFEGLVKEDEFVLNDEPTKTPLKSITNISQGTVRLRLSVVADGETAPPYWTIESTLDDVKNALGVVQADGIATISVLHPCPVIVARKKFAGLAKVCECLLSGLLVTVFPCSK